MWFLRESRPSYSVGRAHDSVRRGKYCFDFIPLVSLQSTSFVSGLRYDLHFEALSVPVSGCTGHLNTVIICITNRISEDNSTCKNCDSCRHFPLIRPYFTRTETGVRKWPTTDGRVPSGENRTRLFMRSDLHLCFFLLLLGQLSFQFHQEVCAETRWRYSGLLCV